MKKRLPIIFIVISILIFGYSCKIHFKIHKFDSHSVIGNITYLSSNNFKGRLPGTFENLEAATFIKNEFKSTKLLPFSNNYYQTFKSYYPEKIKDQNYTLSVTKNNSLIKTYTYSKDYKEDMLNFKNNSINFTLKDNIYVYGKFIRINKNNISYIIYSPENNNINFRSSFMSDSPYGMCIMVKDTVLKEIQKYLSEGCAINCSIPYKVSPCNLNNVIGYIKGSNSAIPPLVISAHFDHVGSDLNETVYNGALDNASGVCFINELSKHLKSLGTPKRNIIFVCFNGEEFGFKGSSDFLNKNKKLLKNSKVLNFDMIGSPKKIPLSIMAGENDSKSMNLLSTIIKSCKKNNITIKCLFQDSSDHTPFRKANIDAVTFCDDDTSRIHTPNDKAEFINTKSIDRCFSAVSPYIIKYSYSNNVFIIYNTQICIGSLVVILILIPVSIKCRKKHTS